MVPVGAVERNVKARCQVRVPVVLIARGAEPGSAKCAFGHYLLPPRRLAISFGNAGYPHKIPTYAPANSVSGVFRQSAPSSLREHPRMPLPALGENIPQQLYLVGHHAVGAEVEGALDRGPRVERPDVNLKAELVGAADELARRDLRWHLRAPRAGAGQPFGQRPAGVPQALDRQDRGRGDREADGVVERPLPGQQPPPGEGRDADPPPRLRPPQHPGQRLDGAWVLEVDVEPQLGEGAKDVLEQRDRRR